MPQRSAAQSVAGPTESSEEARHTNISLAAPIAAHVYLLEEEHIGI